MAEQGGLGECGVLRGQWPGKELCPCRQQAQGWGLDRRAPGAPLCRLLLPALTCQPGSSQQAHWARLPWGQGGGCH